MGSASADERAGGKGDDRPQAPLAEASAKVRDIGVVDEEEDLDWPVWSGVIPYKVTPGEPEPDERCAPGTEPPTPGHTW